MTNLKERGNKEFVNWMLGSMHLGGRECMLDTGIPISTEYS